MNEIKNKGLIFGVIVLIILMIMIMMIVYSSKEEKSTFKSEWEKLNNVATESGEKYPKVVISEDNKIKNITYDELINGINNKEDMVVFFGYPTCLYCRTAIQVLLNTSQEMDIDNILYLDVENKNDRTSELLGILGDNFVDPDDNSKIYSPLVLFVANGNIVSYHKGTLSSQKTPFNELDELQIAGLSKIYKYGIQDVINAIE